MDLCDRKFLSTDTSHPFWYVNKIQTSFIYMLDLGICWGTIKKRWFFFLFRYFSLSLKSNYLTLVPVVKIIIRHSNSFFQRKCLHCIFPDIEDIVWCLRHHLISTSLPRRNLTWTKFQFESICYITNLGILSALHQSFYMFHASFHLFWATLYNRVIDY